MASQTSLDDAFHSGILTSATLFVGLREPDLRRLQEHGYGDRLVLVRYRTADGDDRGSLTVQQVLELPNERREMIRDVFPHIMKGHS